VAGQLLGPAARSYHDSFQVVVMIEDRQFRGGLMAFDKDDVGDEGSSTPAPDVCRKCGAWLPPNWHYYPRVCKACFEVLMVINDALWFAEGLIEIACKVCGDTELVEPKTSWPDVCDACLARTQDE
jgi:hypothetical protein